MKNAFKYTLSLMGLASVLMFCVSATASITSAANVVNQTFSEPMNMLLLGLGLIGLGSYIKNRVAD